MRVLDDFASLTPWTVQHTDDVSAKLSPADGKTGKALRLDYDFAPHGEPVNGYATAHRALPLDLPDNYEISFWVRGEAGVNTFQFKLVDASGANVWWLNRPDFAFPHTWQQIRIRKRQLDFAWGPTSDRVLHHSASVEFVVASGRDGGAGSVEIDDLSMRALPPADTSPLRAVRATASSALADAGATAAIDSDPQTAWRSDPARGAAQQLDLDLGKAREFGGLVLHWRTGAMPDTIAVQLSDDAQHWREVDAPRVRSGTDDALLLTESDARHVRLDFAAAAARSYALAGVEFEDLAWGATPNALFGNLAKSAPRGAYPRGFLEQNYWTIVGVDGGPTPALISEDGALQPGKTGFSIEPFLRIGSRLLTWADVASTQELRDGYLPMPRVTWKAGDIELAIDAFADGSRARSQLIATYTLANASAQPRRVELALAIRPFQVNPPMQFLNSPGGVAPIHDIARDGGRIVVDGAPRIVALDAPDAFVASDLRAGTIVAQLRASTGPAGDVARPQSGLPGSAGEAARAEQARTDGKNRSRVHDAAGHANGALVYSLELPAHGAHRITLLLPLTGEVQTPPGAQPVDAWIDARAQAVAAAWRARLDRVQLRLPPQAQRIADTIRSAHAHMLLSRDGPALRPGTRSYARSWIRDGAMIADALLRLGDTGAVRDYVDWYAPHQFANGKVPCCVDHRGSDPVPENDSHGELIHAIAQLYRYGGDRAELERQWPHVVAAIDYMDALRASETGAADAAFKGLLPASISHEGYSAKPMHSYWDDFWGLTGYKDAAAMAQVLGKAAAAARIAHGRDAFASDIHASIRSATQARGIDFIPGSAELGDFDATSTTIALAPAGEQAQLPQDLLHATFDRYWREFAARAAGAKAWKDYTPYEWRTVGSFVRLGERAHAQAAIDFFYASGVRPAAWNQWAEVVRHDPRTPGFIGDMPHAWVASDFVRSALDLFAYERAADQALVLAAGVPADWLDGDGIAVEHLRTPYGELGYTLRREGGRIVLRVGAGARPPGGFVFAWPGTATARVAVDGKATRRSDAGVPFATSPARVEIEE